MIKMYNVYLKQTKITEIGDDWTTLRSTFLSHEPDIKTAIEKYQKKNPNAELEDFEDSAYLILRCDFFGDYRVETTIDITPRSV